MRAFAGFIGKLIVFFTEKYTLPKEGYIYIYMYALENQNQYNKAKDRMQYQTYHRTERRKALFFFKVAFEPDGFNFWRNVALLQWMRRFR